MLRFQKKGGESREIPVRHDLEGYILASVDAVGIAGETKDTPLFQASNGRPRAMTSKRICELVKRRVRDAGLPDDHAETGRRHTMNILLWVLQVLAALLYGASGVMKVFMFDKVSEGVRSFGALPRETWMALGILELVCTVGLIIPGAFRWQPALTVVAATVLAIESLVFIGVHVKYREITPIILSGVLGLLMAFIACGRMVVKPIV